MKTYTPKIGESRLAFLTRIACEQLTNCAFEGASQIEYDGCVCDLACLADELKTEVSILEQK